MKPTVEALDFYPIQIQRIPEDEGGGYSACYPSLGRLAFEGSGPTQEKALKKLREVAAILIDEFRSQKVELPEPPRNVDELSGKFVIRLPKYLHAILSENADRNGVSLNTFVVSILGDTARAPDIQNSLNEIKKALSGKLTTRVVRGKPSSSSDVRSGWSIYHFGEQVENGYSKVG